MRLLDLFCGAGGAAVGYHRAGFTEIVGVDLQPQPRYPFTFVLADALEFVREHGHDFDVIHASPPCQAYTPITNRRPSRQPRLIEPLRVRLQALNKPFVIENVPGAPLRVGLRLCGSTFGLRVHRHRLFESSELLWASAPCLPDAPNLSIYGPPDGRRLWTRTDGSVLRAWNDLEEGRAALDVSWMTEWREVREALPPAYTEYIGRQLLARHDASGD